MSPTPSIHSQHSQTSHALSAHDLSPPPIDIRWLHAGSLYLNLPSNPITVASTSYAAFSQTENKRLEEAWWRLTDEERTEFSKKGGVAGDKVDTRGNTKENKQEDGLKSVEKEDGTLTVNSGADASRLGMSSHDKDGDGIETPPDGPTHGQGGVMMEKTDSERADLESRTIGSGRVGKRRTMVLEDLETVRGVPVAQDGLFEVSLSTMSLFPVFWAHSGPRIPVVRATWYLGDEGHPAEWELAEELERGYLEIKPYLPSYPDELQKALEQGSSAEDKLKVALSPGVAALNGGAGTTVVFRDEECGELVTSGMSSYLSKMFWSSLRSKSSGTMVYRGYAAAKNNASTAKTGSAEASKERSRRGSASSMRSTKSAGGGEKAASSTGKPSGVGETRKGLDGGKGTRLDDVFKVDRDTRLERMTSHESEGGVPAPKGSKDGEGKGLNVDRIQDEIQTAGQEIKDKLKNASGISSDGLREEQVPITLEEEGDSECSDLFLVIHGIGQQLSQQYESFNFVYAANILRQVMRTQAQNPALASIIRDRRVQVLPIQWRASLQLDQYHNEEDVAHAMDNRFTMADITLPKIPVIRQLTNSVLLDIPLFMSHHRQSMIEAVCYQANRAYRLWCARNPNFDGKGRVHLIGHSLGSALAAHILSQQPTKMPPLCQLPKSVIASTKNQFLFNTSSLFLAGSPLGVFLHLDQAQIMPRKGRERTMHSPQDEALDRAGRFGCMSCDSVYNILHLSDPIAYMLNAAVDSKLAKKMQPLPITSVTAPFYTTVTDKLPAISQYLPPLPYFISSAKPSGAAGKKPSLLRLPSGIEMSGPEGEEQLQGSRAERRFSALNPHGNIDFVLPSGGVSEYLDALTSHASYWSDPNFGAFLLAEIFSKRLDLLRTGMGLSQGGILPEDIPL